MDNNIDRVLIISNNACFGPFPRVDDGIEQHLTICRNSQVDLVSYSWGAGNSIQLQSSLELRIAPTDAEEIFNLIWHSFPDAHISCTSDDNPRSWEMHIFTSDSNTYSFSGVLMTSPVNSEISDKVRKALSRNDLYVLDGGCSES